MPTLRPSPATRGRPGGGKQRDACLGDLERRFEWLAENPLPGTLRADICEGYRSYPQGAHIVFYVVREDAIDIIGVVHQSMDVEGYFDAK